MFKQRYFLLIKPNEVYRGDEINIISFKDRSDSIGTIYYKNGHKERTQGSFSTFIDVLVKAYKEILPEEATLII